ncbi:hypothetical protein [Streptomyces alfalfae]
MAHEDEQITPIHTVPVTTVRITWLDVAGTPDHPWAVTYHFGAPVDLTLGRRLYQLPMGTPRGRASTSGEYLAHLTAPYDHEERMGVAYLAATLQRHAPKCVEACAEMEMEDGLWWYALLPWWHTHLIHQDWPMKTEDGQELHAAGRLHEVGAHTWPPTCPLDEPRTVEPGAAALIARTRVPPPPPGSPPPHPAARHARRPARSA